MSDSTESKIERERRVWLEAGERLKDLEEDYQAAKVAGTLTDELKIQLTETRRIYRTRGEQSGKRAGMVVSRPSGGSDGRRSASTMS